MLHGLKYLQAERRGSTDKAQSYVRELVKRYQLQAAGDRAKSWQELSARKKWLHLEEILQVVKTQREAYESQIDPALRARESQDYAVLLLYTAIPPGRAKEYRTLQLQVHKAGELMHVVHQGKRDNALHISEDGASALLHLQDFKNVCSTGRQTVDLSTTDYLLSHLHDFVCRDRTFLLRGNSSHNYLFVVSA